MKIEFELTEEQVSKYKAWYKEQNAKAANMQVASGYLDGRESIKASVIEQQKPYPGFTSAGPKWILSECGIGTTIEIEHWYTHERLDLTDYDTW